MGYWSNHEYTRRSVKDITDFIGWVELRKQYDQVLNLTYDKTRAMLPIVAFLTGGRAWEILLLRKKNFRLTGTMLEFRRVPILKRYDKLISWTQYEKELPNNVLAKLFSWNNKDERYERKRYDTKKKIEYRTASFPREEPFTNALLSYLDEVEDYLFPGYASPSKTLGKRFKEHDEKVLSYSTFYRTCQTLGTHTHWYRAQRASCLVLEYEYELAPLMEWFRWEDMKTALRYVRMGTKTFDKLFQMKLKPFDASEFMRVMIDNKTTQEEKASTVLEMLEPYTSRQIEYPEEAYIT